MSPAQPATSAGGTRPTPVPAMESTLLHRIQVESRYYRPELDWLRFLAFSLVFAHHTLTSDPQKYAELGIPAALAQFVLLPLAGAGGHGVDLFFALSAFLITELLLREKAKSGSVHILAFYVRRTLRIWPLYFLVVLILFPYEILTTDNPISYYVLHLFFLGNWYAALWAGFATATGHLWTVSVEEQFYFTWPYFVRYARIRVLAVLMIALFLFATVYRCARLYDSWPMGAAVHNDTFARLDSFALGGLLACALHNRTLILAFGYRIVLLSVAIGSFWVIGRFANEFEALSALWAYSLASVGSAAGLMSFLATPSRKTMGWPLRFIAYLGKISYGLYMWHVPIIACFSFGLSKTSLPWTQQFWLRTLGAAALTLVVSMLSYSLLEKPFLRMKRRFTFVESRPE